MKNSNLVRSVRLLVIASLGGFSFLRLAAAVDPAALISKAEVTALLGQPVLAVTPAAESVDEDTGGKLVFCTYRAGQVAVVVSVVTFGSAKEALAKMTKEQAAERMEGDGAAVVAESGLGDRAFWATSDNGAEYIVVKGPHVLGLGIGGKLPRAPASYHDRLRVLAASAVAKL